MPDALIWIYAGVLGALIGSFLNVCITRWPEGESVVSPRSRCPGCGSQIAWYDNIPIFSWLVLRARCRSCRTPISPIYPAVEAVTALVWVAAAVRYGLSWQALSVAIFFTLLLGIAATDARTYLIPDEFTLGGLAIGLLLALTPGGLSILHALGGAALGFGLLYLTSVLGEWWLQKPAMGGRSPSSAGPSIEAGWPGRARGRASNDSAKTSMSLRSAKSHRASPWPAAMARKSALRSRRERLRCARATSPRW
ncbi:MAG: prepilin peptidase, partial [Gemmatimonadota bacterium]